MSTNNARPGWCDTMERPKEACGCPDCGSSLIDIDGMRNTPPAGAMPTLPRSLLNLLGEYGMARTDRVSQVEVTHRWLLVIAGIKQYAAVQLEAERARNAAKPMTRDDVERQYIDGIHIGSGLPRATCPCGFCAKYRDAL